MSIGKATAILLVETHKLVHLIVLRLLSIDTRIDAMLWLEWLWMAISIVIGHDIAIAALWWRRELTIVAIGRLVIWVLRVEAI